MRRGELERLGIQLPVLPTIVLGALPGPPDWAVALERAGLDVIASGAASDTPATWAAAREAVPHRLVKATAGPADELSAVGAVVIESAGEVPEGCYRLGPDEVLAPAVRGDAPRAEDPNEVAEAVLRAADLHGAAAVWVAATPGLEGHEPELVKAKVRALVEGARLARLLLAKHQFDD